MSAPQQTPVAPDGQQNVIYVQPYEVAAARLVLKLEKDLGLPHDPATIAIANAEEETS